MTKNLDAIIFGATGFSGKIAVQDAVDLLKDFKWGIAGRNKSKLETVLQEVGTELKRDLSNIPIVVADVSDEESIKEMAKQCKIVLNCCGPYALYGEVVVKACIEAGTHHVDISGEPEYIDGMQLKYHDLARDKGVYIISTCAFDSLPSEMGVVYAERNFDGTVNSIETYLENTWEHRDKNSNALLNVGTWASVIYALKNIVKSKKLQNEINSQLPLPELNPPLKAKLLMQKPSFAKGYYLPFPFGDLHIVDRSQRRLYQWEEKRPIQFMSYIGFSSLFWAIFLPLYLPLIVLIAFLPFGHKFLINNVEFFTFGRITHQGPTVPNQEGHTFKMYFKARGWSKDKSLTSAPDKEQLTCVSGTNPFYGLTSAGLILTARTILRESDKMPGSGGVLPPAAAFYKTSLIEQLSQPKNGLKFEVLK